MRLTGFAAILLLAGSAPAALAQSAEPREQTADQQVVHALNRLGFGPRPGDVERVRRVGVDRWIEQQLRPERIDDRETARFLERYGTLGLDTERLVRDYPPPAVVRAMQQRAAADGRSGMQGAPAGAEPPAVDTAAYRRAAQRANRIAAELVSARVARAVISERQLNEVLVDFWHNHFSVFIGKNPVMRHYLVAYDRDVIRPHALGKFRELLGAVARSQAMLVYLDNAQSVADSGRPTLARDGRMRPNGAVRGGRMPARRPGGAIVMPGGAPGPRPGPGLGGAGMQAGDPPRPPRRRGLNENYARELLELHTLGADGGYTQQDVIEVARAFTGWTIDAPLRGGGFVFRPRQHDAGEKTVLGHRLPAGRGVEDGERVLDIVARHPATARHVATRLAQRLVSDDPPAALVERAAETFRRTDGDIRETVRTIVTSPEFFSRAAYRAKVKSPFETVVSALRAVGAEPDSTPRTAQLVARLGQPLYGRQSPDGWPETGTAWMNTGAILNRINFGLLVASGRVPGARLDRWPEGARLAALPRDAQVDGVVLALLGGDVSPDTRAILRSGTNPLLAAPSGASGSPAAVPDESRDAPPMMAGLGASVPRARRERRTAAGGALGRVPELHGLAQIVGLALGAPEFQRR